MAAGSLCGFLLHNWPPASIYLGDSGSLMIGFVIGALAIESSIKKATGFALAIPLVLVSVPVFDTCMAIVRRKLNGRGIGEADRGHIHHCLQDRGLSRAQSLLVISALCVVMAAVTLVSAYFQNDRLALGLCLALLALLIVGRVFGYDETILFFRYIQAMSTLLAATSGVLRTQMAVDRMAAHATHGPHRSLERTDRTRRGDGRARARIRLPRRDGRRAVPPRTGRVAQPRTQRGGRLAIPIHGPRAATASRRRLSSHGRLHGQLRGQRLVDLFRLFDTFCRSWMKSSFIGRGRRKRRPRLSPFPGEACGRPAAGRPTAASPADHGSQSRIAGLSRQAIAADGPCS